MQKAKVTVRVRTILVWSDTSGIGQYRYSHDTFSVLARDTNLLTRLVTAVTWRQPPPLITVYALAARRQLTIQEVSDLTHGATTH